ncbi:MAG: ATP-binding protein, partial [Methyloligellaceae bacterium]
MAAEGTIDLDELVAQTKDEYERTQRELKEIALMVEQSRGEVNKLASRNATINSHLHQIQEQFETVPRSDIKSTYDAAQEAQQRLFTMRGQLEKLQSDQTSLERYAAHLEATLAALGTLGDTPILTGSAQRADAPTPDATTRQTVLRVIDAQEAERRRLSRAMHDGPAQSLTNFILQAEIVQRLFDTDPERARTELTNLKTTAATTFQRVRDFISELRPMMLDDLGLIPTIRRYVTAFEEKSGLETTLTLTGEERRMESHIEVVAFRGLQELLANARDHAQATRIRVTVDVESDMCRIVVQDNGRGFDLAQAGNIFAPFSRLSEDDEIEGQGVGLAIVQRII